MNYPSPHNPITSHNINVNVHVQNSEGLMLYSEMWRLCVTFFFSPMSYRQVKVISIKALQLRPLLMMCL